jgi:integral membrane sensor domain MASE1
MWVNQSVVAGIHSFVSHWPFSNLGCVLLQVAIGAALVSGPFTRPALGISVAWALVIWWLGESFGMLPSGIELLGRRPRSGPAVCDVRCDGMAAPAPS